MRVAFTLEQCWHRVPGGTAASELARASALARRADVDIVGVAARHHHPPTEGFAPSVAVRQLRLPRPLLYEAWHHLRRPRVEQATGPVDVVHATTLVVPPRSAPLVVTLHDLAFVHEPSHFTARGVRILRRGFELTRRQADLVLCPSSATLEDAAAHGIDRGRLRLVPHGVDSRPVTQADVVRVRRRYGLDGGYLLFAGTREPRKNLARLVEAFERAPGGRRLVLAGPKGWGTRGQEQPVAGEDAGPGSATASGRVLALGFVPADDLRALYAGADAFVYPSLREGFGLPVLEAMAQGTAVVTSKGTATEEVAGGAAVLVDPLDVADIERGMVEALDRRAELARAGRARAAEMTWARTAELTVAAYRDATWR